MERRPPLALLEETVGLLHQWWGPPHRATAEGPLPIHDWERSIVPVSCPPIYLAAVGPKALELAGRRADGVLFNELASTEYLAWAIGQVRESAIRAERNPDDLAFFVNSAVQVTDDPEPALERKKGFIATVHALPGMERLLETSGFDIAGILKRVRQVMKTEEILARGGGFPEMRREGDLEAARKAIPTELVAQLAVVGPLDVVRERVKSLANLGATHIFLDRRGMPANVDAVRNILAELRNDRPSDSIRGNTV
jgi:alkanesulfonate monooxygenase SsuD/methylene tetrahydromethanopterin reductase-like flavin-dependent oxidoreductase (luciferase family)